MSDERPYLKLTCETRFDDGRILVRSIKTGWDIGIEEFHQTCRLLALAVGYHPESVKRYFYDQE